MGVVVVTYFRWQLLANLQPIFICLEFVERVKITSRSYRKEFDNIFPEKYLLKQ